MTFNDIDWNRIMHAFWSLNDYLTISKLSQVYYLVSSLDFLKIHSNDFSQTMRSSSSDNPSTSSPKISLTAFSDFSGSPSAVLNSTTSNETSLSVESAAPIIDLTSCVSRPSGTFVPVLHMSSGSSESTSKLIWIGASRFLMKSIVP